jgi:cystathionine beta-lyase/cystathionine gamma-synthase
MAREQARKRPVLIPEDKAKELFRSEIKQPWPVGNRSSDGRFRDKGLNTQCIHAAERETQQNLTTASVPIYMSNTFWTESATPGRDWQRDQPSYGYSRSGNPNEAALSKAVATLENGEVCVSVASGMAAIHLALITALQHCHGNKILFSEDVYGSVYDLMDITLFGMGTQVEHEDFTDLNRLEETIKRERPDAICFEIITNPLCKVIDAPAVIELGHRYGATVIADNTWTTPFITKPMEMGADYVVQSLSKFFAGHGDVLGGAIICRNEKELVEKLFFNRMKLGPAIGHFEAWLIMRGIKTLGLRFPRQCENAMVLAHFLQEHPLVSRVDYPGLPSHPHHDIARKFFANDMYGALMRWDIRDCDYDKAVRFRNATQIATRAGTLGDVFTEINYCPAVPRYHRYTQEAQAAMGIYPGTMRMSAGCEDIQDLFDDLDQALRASQ